MPSSPSVAWLRDAIVPWDEARLPLEDRGLQFAESVYEVVMVTAGLPRLLAAHAERMRRGAEALGIERGLPSLADWERIAEALVSAEAVEEGLLYAQLTGGAGPRIQVPADPYAPTFFAYLRAHRFPRAAEVGRGVRVVTLPDPRWDRSDLKTTMLLPGVIAKREAERRGADEAILLGPEGDVREGTTSNVFLVEEGRILSPAQDRHLLAGTTRSLVEQVAAEAGLSVAGERISRERLLAASEVFLTSTSRLAMPVLSVDDRAVGAGVAGPIASELARRLRERLGIGEDR